MNNVALKLINKMCELRIIYPPEFPFTYQGDRKHIQMWGNTGNNMYQEPLLRTLTWCLFFWVLVPFPGRRGSWDWWRAVGSGAPKVVSMCRRSGPAERGLRTQDWEHFQHWGECFYLIVYKNKQRNLSPCWYTKRREETSDNICGDY